MWTKIGWIFYLFMIVIYAKDYQDFPLSWRCPEIAQQPAVECSCDMPHTLRCNGDRAEAMQIIGRKLRSLPPRASVSLLDCTVQNVSALPGPLLEGVALHGLVVSSGEIKDVHKHAFMGLASPLQALGLPNNQLSTVPTAAFAALPALDRLDLSHNLLRRLDNSSFRGLGNLSFLDLSDNKISEITKDAFAPLPQLRTLRLRGNGLTIPIISTLRAPSEIYDLDLSSNSILGPLGKHTVPSMPPLKILQLSHNMLSSVKRGSLKGFPKLLSLILHHNQIDVLEDYAFENVATLNQLDLSHNRIVAVSGASLAYLTNLAELDLSHNFLRAVTADLILPLKRLMELNLDDNDISIIASDAFKPGVELTKLNLAENPLNCDCSLTEFATWLMNSSLPMTDKTTLVCTTPPSLENALLVQIQPDALHCGEDEHEPVMAPPSSLVDEVPVANVHLTLDKIRYTNTTTILEWQIDPNAIPYTCDTLFIYEDQGIGEVLIETYKFACNSRNSTDPQKLEVEINNLELGLEDGHKYRYCIVLFEGNTNTDDISLIVGCSDIVNLHQRMDLSPVRNITQPEISDINVDFTTVGNIIVNVKVLGSKQCVLNIRLFEKGGLLKQTWVNCSESHFIFNGLVSEGPYEICVGLSDRDNVQCVPAQLWPSPTTSVSMNQMTNVLLVVICVALSAILLLLMWCLKRLLMKPKVQQTHQYFLPPPIEDEQHSRYVKLQATTKL